MFHLMSTISPGWAYCGIWTLDTYTFNDRSPNAIKIKIEVENNIFVHFKEIEVQRNGRRQKYNKSFDIYGGFFFVMQGTQ